MPLISQPFSKHTIHMKYTCLQGISAPLFSHTVTHLTEGVVVVQLDAVGDTGIRAYQLGHGELHAIRR